MNKCINAQDANKPICEHIGCNSDAVENITVKVGNKKIFLSLCNNCKMRFSQDANSKDNI